MKLTGGQIASIDLSAKVNDKFVAELEDRLDRNLRRASEYFLGVIRPALPEESGHLKSTAKVKPIPKNKKNPMGGYRVDTEFYLFFYEYGTETRRGTVRQPAKQITNPLLEQHEQKIIDLVTEGL